MEVGVVSFSSASLRFKNNRLPADGRFFPVQQTHRQRVADGVSECWRSRGALLRRPRLLLQLPFRIMQQATSSGAAARNREAGTAVT